jgi:hypothetical protein
MYKGGERGRDGHKRRIKEEFYYFPQNFAVFPKRKFHYFKERNVSPNIHSQIYSA